ncbi:glutamate--tRNA ligase [candidate division SR1 bacterium]|nr:glutamate--tRNA ligase [candidate division SR1 bacterium]
MSRLELANLLFPEVDYEKMSIESLLAKYPERNQNVCDRIAPSPTGYFHFGNLFTALVNWKYARQNDGIFYLRVEDTDQLRKVDDAVDVLLASLDKFGLNIDEGPEIGGEYGPYFQSERREIYLVFIKYLVSQGLAYPCWMSAAEIESIRSLQTEKKLIPGIYGEFSKYRNFTPDQLAQTYHSAGDTFEVIRFRSPADLTHKITFNDEIRGEISMIDNYNDIVILKKDGLPTYHLAHIVDDTLMRTSLVMRGEEWLTSVPLHIQLFKSFGLKVPAYAHVAPICKLDQGKKRKLSKRHDPEANVAFFFQKGYQTQALIEYIMTLADSSFEDRRKDHVESDLSEFHFELSKMSVSGSLFDQQKLDRIANSHLSQVSTEELYNQTLDRARIYHPDYAKLLQNHPDYAKFAINIERFTPKDPKRYTTYADVMAQTINFFDEIFISGEVRQSIVELINSTFSAEMLDSLQLFISDYSANFNLENDTEVRFNQLKEIGGKYGFAANNAQFKEGGYVGKVGDLAMFLRIKLLNSKQTPDLFSMMKVMGRERVISRLMFYS